MNYAHKSSKVLIAGASGTGKTTFWLQYIHRSPHALKFVFDGEGEFAERAKEGIVCRELNQLARAVKQVVEGKAKTNVVIFDPSIMFPGAIEEAFDFFCEWAFAMSEQMPGIPKLLAIDELQNVIHTNIIPQSFRKVLETGRRYSLDFVGITQALNLIHNRVRNQITELVVFRTGEKRALEYVESAEFDPETIANLRDMHFTAKDMKTGNFQSGKMRPWLSPKKSKILFDGPPAPDLIEQAAEFFSPDGEGIEPASEN